VAQLYAVTCHFSFHRFSFSVFQPWLSTINYELSTSSCEKRLTTIFQIKTFIVIRLFQQAIRLLRSCDQIVHFGYLPLRE